MAGDSKLFAVVNLGCKVNRVESDMSAALLLAAGWRRFSQAIDKPEEVSLVVVNTCAVTSEAEKKTRKAVRSTLSRYPSAHMLVTGCAAALHPASFLQLDGRIEFVAKAELEKRVAFLAASHNQVRPFDDAQSFFRSPDHAALCSVRTSRTFPTRVGVKIQDGCDNDCTYCVVHIARGPSVSRPWESVADECVALAQAGAREIVLTGINLGSYRLIDSAGNDAASASGRPFDLCDLLEILLAKTADLRGQAEQEAVRFRLSSIEPCDVSDRLIDLLAAGEGRICRHLHLPLQAGSSEVLQRMHRPYDARFYRNLVAKLYTRLPRLALSTDIIVGFPGETEAQFQETLNLARLSRFAKIHVFPYSQREGTPAAQWADQVPAPEKERRALLLRQLGDELRAEDMKRRAGTIERAIVEEGGRVMTESYYEFPAPDGAAVGSLVPFSFPASVAAAAR